MIAGKAALDVEFQQYRTDLYTKLGLLRSSLEDETRCEDGAEKIVNDSFFSKKPLKVQLWNIPDDSEKVQDLQYQLDSALSKEHRAQKAAGSLRS